ncbi:MAG TPA: alpha/beta hydrolase, partial [Acidimicrobiia bacterium]|nr:alpha/beta hydrolase [Acidimicrobiia bacterium]
TVVAPAVIAAFVPPTSLGPMTPVDLGLAYEDVVFSTSDGVELSGWYLPSTNGAAVMLRHGSGSTRSGVLDKAVVLASHGYGVLLADARGHGLSAGRGNDFGWWGDLDTEAGVTFLTGRADVDLARIGVVGSSMGGEEAIGAAAADPRIRVVVAEGATGRTVADKDWYSEEYGLPGVVQEGIEWLTTTLVDLLSPAPRPTALRDGVGGATGTPFLLIAGGNVADEVHVVERLATFAPERVDTWVVAGSGHTGGLRTEPEEWERRVVFILDGALLGP